MSTYSDDEKALIELRRELGMRQQVYPKLIEKGSLPAWRAQSQNDALRHAITIVETKCQESNPQADLFGAPHDA